LRRDAWKQVTDSENKSKDVLYKEYVNKLVEVRAFLVYIADLLIPSQLLKKDGDVTRLNELKAAA
jgi:hypothetical protein